MDDAVVISGVGAHFPQCDNLQEYREKLLRNLHLISDGAGELQPRYTAESVAADPGATLTKDNMKSGKMRHGDKFDNTFFGMHSRLAAATDSITRHVLESTLESVIDAGYCPRDLHGSNTAVFMGYHCSESESNFIRESADGFGIMGLNAAMTANRVSYWLDLKGPSFTHNTQLVSSMQSLDMAFRAISSGECDRAVVGAASLSYLTELATHYDDLGWLSPSGTCKPFDEAADGGVRSEAVVVLLLERRSTARRVYAEVVHTTATLSAETSRSELPDIERHVMRHSLDAFYKECGVRPDHVAYVEADGWGVAGIDEAEVGALDDVLGRTRARPLLIGSVKGNIGQTEAASGLASICKVLVALESGTIPATLNHVRPNSRIAGIRQGRVKVVSENTVLPPGLVAVNDVGLGGILGHVLLRPNPRIKAPSPSAGLSPAEGAPMPRLLLLSGRTPEGLAEAISLAEASALDPEYVHLLHGAFSSHIFGHMYRGFSVVPKADPARPAHTQFYTGQKRPVWFVYSGMGSQWAGMGADLLRIPVFAAAVERCHQALVPLGVDLKHILTSEDPAIFDNILHSFVGIAAVQVGLTDVLHAVGVHPDGIVGHSVGELGCAYADGCITAEQMMLAAHARGQASNETKLAPGMMAAVGLGYKDILPMLPEPIEVACHNSATSCTLSGPAADMHAFVAQLKEQGIFARAVNVSNIAYHSRCIRPAAPRLLELLQGVIVEPRKRSARWISTSVLPAQANDHDAQYATAQYFTNNLTSSVYFEEACDQVDKDALAIEIAPHGLLQAILKRSLHKDAVNVALTKRGEPGTGVVLEAIGKLYVEGMNPLVAKLYPPVDTPVCRDTAPLSPLATWDHRDSWPVAFLKAADEAGPRSELRLPLDLATTEFGHLAHCTWNGHTLLSPATCMSLVLSLVSSYAPEGRPIVLHDVVFFDPVVVPAAGAEEVYVFVQRGSGRFEVSVQGRLACTGHSAVISEQDQDPLGPAAALPQEDRTPYDSDDLYEELGRRGLQCRGPLRCLATLLRGARAVLGTAACREDDPDCSLEAVRTLQMEALLQVVALQQSEDRHELHVPKRIQKVIVDPGKVAPDGSRAELEHDLRWRRTSLLSARGRVDMLQVDTQALSLPPTFQPILVQTRRFVAYGAGAVEDLHGLCSLSLQLAALQSRVPVQVTALQAQDTDELLDAVARVADQQLPDLRVRVAGVAEVADSAALVLSDASNVRAALAAVRRQRGLLLTETPPNFSPPPELRVLLCVQQGRRRYALLKHVVDVDRSSEVLHVTDALPLEPQLERLTLAQTAVVYVVFGAVSHQAVPGIMRALAAAPGGNRAHCVFLQDAAADFSLDAEPYAAQLRLGLRGNMLQAGRWGWVHRLHLANLAVGGEGGQGGQERPRLQRTRQLHMDALQVRCLGINPYSEVAEDAHTAVGLLDYAGVRADGVRVMGVCASGAGPLQPDAILTWPVPPTWSDEAAATVPLTYATAVLALHEKMAVTRGERALVVDAASPLGHVAVVLLLRAGCRVVAAVKDAPEEASLRSQFPGAHLDTVVGAAEQVVRELPRRFGSKACVDVLLSQGSAAAFETILPLLKSGSRAVHVGTRLADVGDCVGMAVFMKSASVYSVAWDWPLRARADTKRRVRAGVLAAIRDAAVQPLPCQTAPPSTLAASQRRVAEGAGKVVLSMSTLEEQKDDSAIPLLDASRGCLVLGPAAKAVTLAEWLLSVGASDVSVVPSTAPAGRAVSAWVSRRLAALAAHYGATVRALPAAEPREIVRAAGRLVPLGLVLALEQPPARVRALSAATRVPGCTLAVLTESPRDLVALSDAMRLRKDDGFPGVVASVGDLPADVRPVPLGQVLRCARDPAVHTVEVTQAAADAGQGGMEGEGAALLPYLLPSSVEALRRLGQSLQDSVSQRVLTSLIGGPADRRNKEVPPVFLVAGLTDSPTRELGLVARFTHATTLVVSPPSSASSVEEAAAAVARAVVRAQPCGPYTVVGRGWGGAVALETARLLAESCYVTAFLLDASTDAMQAALRPLQRQPSGLPTALLKYLLKLDRETEERVYRTAEWPAQMRVALGREDAVLEAALDCVLRRVEGLTRYQPAHRGACDHKVAVTLVSNQPYHLQSAAISEVVSEVLARPLLAATQHADVSSRQAGAAISAGVHVGRATMQARRGVASLQVTF